MTATATRPVEQVQLEPGWKQALAKEFSKPYMHEIKTFLLSAKKQGKTIYPPGNEIFAAFNLTPFDQVKVVIIGQDPYHGPGQAHGLCFSVKPGVRPPPSLRNIYKELNADISFEPPAHGYLSHWAQQGVLMLNAVLTVEHRQAASHQNLGWETFTDSAIRRLNDTRENIVFLLWGAYAQRKGAFIDRKRHFVLQAPHPSPFAAHKGFFGCRHFSQTNKFLTTKGLGAINWQLPSI